MQQEKEDSVNIPIRTLIAWLIATVSAVTGVQWAMPEKDVFASREWLQIVNKVEQNESRTNKLETIQYRIGRLEQDCAKRGP